MLMLDPNRLGERVRFESVRACSFSPRSSSIRSASAASSSWTSAGMRCARPPVPRPACCSAPRGAPGRCGAPPRRGSAG